MFLRGIEQQSNRGNHCAANNVEQTFEHVYPKHVRNGDFRIAGKQQRSNRFAWPPEKKNCGEPCQGHSINWPKFGLAQIALKNLPTQGSQREAKVNQYDAKQDVKKVGAAD